MLTISEVENVDLNNFLKEAVASALSGKALGGGYLPVRFVNFVDVSHNLGDSLVKFGRDFAVDFKSHQHIDKRLVLVDGHGIFLRGLQNVFGDVSASLGYDFRRKVAFSLVL